MKFLVFSDTHSDISAAEDVLKKHPDADKILHLGDYLADGIKIGTLAGKEVIGVKGNMDGGYKNRDIQVVETEAGNILLTHGHTESVNFDLTKLYYLALEHGCTCALYGHTHLPFMNEEDGVLFFNPGSLSDPRGGRKASYGVLTANENGFSAAIHYLDDELLKKKPAAAPRRSGLLRDMLNNSDRF